MELLRILDGKLAGTDCRVDCLLSYAADADMPPVPHGWIPTAIEIFWPARSGLAAQPVDGCRNAAFVD